MASPFMTYLEASQMATPLRQFQSQTLTFHSTNKLQSKQISKLNAYEIQTTVAIESVLKSQKSDLDAIQGSLMKELAKEANSLQQEICEAQEAASGNCTKISQVALQIRRLEHDLRKNIGYHGQLDNIVDQFADPNQTIQVPFQFFYDLHREQEREVAKLAE